MLTLNSHGEEENTRRQTMQTCEKNKNTKPITKEAKERQ